MDQAKSARIARDSEENEETKVKAIKEATNESELWNALKNAEESLNLFLVEDAASLYAAEILSNDLDTVEEIQGAVNKANAKYAMPTATKATGTDDVVLTINVKEGITPLELEVDHSLESQLPEFSVYADSDNPYGDSAETFETVGVEVKYVNGTWTITFPKSIGEGEDAVDISNIVFYLLVKDVSGNSYGSMYNGGYLTVN